MTDTILIIQEIKTCWNILYDLDVLIISRFTHLKQGNQRWQIPRPATCQCLATFTPLKSKMLIFFRDVINCCYIINWYGYPRGSHEKYLKEIVRNKIPKYWPDTQIHRQTDRQTHTHTHTHTHTQTDRQTGWKQYLATPSGGEVIILVQCNSTCMCLPNMHIITSKLFSVVHGDKCIISGKLLWVITSPPERVARYCFHPVCLSVCVCVCVCLSVCLSVYLCVRPIFWYFISRLLEEISIWNLYRILIWLYSIH